MEINRLDSLCKQYEDYFFGHFFDKDRILLSYIDKTTGKPFSIDYLSTQKLGRLSCEDPEEYCAYEDSMMCYGFFLTYLYEKYNATGDSSVLNIMKTTNENIMKIYKTSQQVEKGYFGRPYGGLNRLVANREPLGTDQIAPLLSGVWLYRKVAPDKEKREIDEMMVDSLEWYRMQGYEYLWYKFFVHKYTDKGMSHALNYYLPCTYWAYNVTGDTKYLEDYNKFFEFIFYSLSRHEISFTFRFRFWLFWLAENTGDRVLWKSILKRIITLDRKMFYNDKNENEYYDAFTDPSICFADEFNMFIAKDGYSYRPSKENQDGMNINIESNDPCGYVISSLRMVPSALLANIAKYVQYTGENREDIGRVKEILAIHDDITKFTEMNLQEGGINPPDSQYPLRSMAAKHIIHWLIAYWRVKQIEAV